MNAVDFTMRISPALREKLDDIARDLGVTKAEVVRRWITAFWQSAFERSPVEKMRRRRARSSPR